MSMDMSSSRRAFLLQASALAVTAAMPAGLAAQQADAGLDAPIDMAAIEQQAAKIPNRDTLLKFNANGTPRPFAGNTVICHLPVQSVMRDAMVPLHQELAAAPFARKLGLTSTDSYHMTVFPGANDQDRSAYGWPSYVPLNVSMEECNRLVGERMAAARLRCKLPIRVRVDVAGTLNYFTACTLRMVPENAGENAKLRAVRDQLAERSEEHTSELQSQ